MKNKRKEWEFEGAHIITYMAALLLSENWKDIGSGKSDIYILLSPISKTHTFLVWPDLMCQGRGYPYQLPSRTSRYSIHTIAPNPNPNKGVEQHLSQALDLNGGEGPQSGTMCSFMFYISAVDSVHSYRHRNE